MMAVSDMAKKPVVTMRARTPSSSPLSVPLTARSLPSRPRVSPPSRRTHSRVGGLPGPHHGALPVLLVVVPEQVQDAVDDEQAELRIAIWIIACRDPRAHHDVAEQTVLAEGKRQHVRGPRLPEVPFVERGHLVGIDER